MRKIGKDFIHVCAESLPITEPVMEFGAYQVEGQEGFADLRPLFPGKKYVGCDVRQGPGVDLIVDAQMTSLPDGSVGTVLSVDTLEHVVDPAAVAREAFRILREDGIFILVTVMNFIIHEHPQDYWRFTPGGIGLLLGIFPERLVVSAGNPLNPHTVAGVGAKRPGTIGESFRKGLDAWKVRFK